MSVCPQRGEGQHRTNSRLLSSGNHPAVVTVWIDEISFLGKSIGKYIEIRQIGKGLVQGSGIDKGIGIAERVKISPCSFGCFR